MKSAQKYGKEIIYDTFSNLRDFNPNTTYEISYEKTRKYNSIYKDGISSRGDGTSNPIGLMFRAFDELRTETFKLKSSNGEIIDIGEDFIKGIINLIKQ